MKGGGRGRDKGDVFPVLPEKQVAADGKKLGYRFPRNSDLDAPKKRYPSFALFPGVTKQKQRAFLTHLSTGHGIYEAARLVPVDVRQHYYWLKTDEKYSDHFIRAREIACDIAEDVIYARAITGYRKPVTFKGVITDWYQEYSDTLAMFWLKGARPEKYRDSLVGLTTNAPTAIQINLGVEVKQAPPDVVDEGK